MNKLKLFTRLFAVACITAMLAIPIGTIFASNSADFINHNTPFAMVGPGYTNVLVMDVTIPDGTNGAAEDTLLLDNGGVFWNGHPLSPMAADYYFDDNSSGTWQTTEAIWVDANSDLMISSGEIQHYGTADLELFESSGPLTQGVVFFDVNGDSNYTPGEAIFYDANSDLTLGVSDEGFGGGGPALIRAGVAGVANFDSAAANPGGVCGTGAGGCHGNAAMNDILFCDGPGVLANGTYDIGESIFVDMQASTTLGDYDAGQDYMITDPAGIAPGTCLIAGGIPLPLTSGGPHNVVFLDSNGDGLYGTSLGALPASPPALGEAVINLTAPLPNGAPLSFLNYSGFAPSTPDVSAVIFPEWDNAALKLMNDMTSSHGGTLKFIGQTPGAGNDKYGGEAIINDANNNGILEAGEWVDDDAVGRALGGLHQNFPAGITHTGAGSFTSADSIYDDSTGPTPLILDKSDDQFIGLGVRTSAGSTAVNGTDIASVKVWADGPSAGWDGDEVLLGTMTPHSTLPSEWYLGGLTRDVPAGGQRIFVTVDIAANPTDGASMQFEIPVFNDAGADGVAASDGDLGVFMASNNDGPLDLDIQNTNSQLIDSSQPTVLSITPSQVLLSDADVGASAFTVTVVYNEIMDNSVAPVINFTSPVPTGLSFNSGSWSQTSIIDDTYTATYDLADTNETSTNIDIGVSGATDLVGNPQVVGNAVDAFSIDTQNPTVTIVPSTTLLTDADVGINAFGIALVYDEAMDTAGPSPTLQISPSVSGLSFNSAGWSTTTHPNDTFTYRFNLADNDEEITNIEITQNFIGVVLAQDLAGNTQVSNNLLNAFNVDTKNPTVTGITPNITLINDGVVGVGGFRLEIAYSEVMSGAPVPVVTFTPDIVASGTLTLAGGSWTALDTYRAVYDVADVNEEVTLTNINVTGATDGNGNAQVAFDDATGALVEVDTLNPGVISITPSTGMLTDADVGASAFTVTVVYDDTMDATGANDPTIAFTAPIPTGLTFASGTWSQTTTPNDTYTATYDLADNNETSTDIDIGVTLARDLSGNTQNAGSSPDAFSIDTENPTVTGITPNITLITESDVGAGNFWLDIAYSEAMAGASTPVVTFTPDIVASGTLTLAGGSWTAPDTYRAVYDVADVDENVTLTNVNVSGAADANGNLQVGFNDPTGAGIQVATIGPVVTIVMPDHGGNTRMASPLIVTTDVNCNCTYDLDGAGPVALNQTGGTIHTDNLTALTAGAHTVDISCTDVVTLNVGTASSTWTKQAPGNMVLYGVDGAGSSLGVLWTLNPETGAKLTNIGPMGTYYVTGLAVNPVTGIMYASTGNKDPGNDTHRSLLEIDITTGAATFLGKNWDGAGAHHLADIGFDSTGQLYGWSEVDDNLYSVDLASCDGTSCAATLVGASGLGTYGSGMSFDSGNNLFFVGEDEDNNMYTISTTTGAPLLTIPLLNGTGNNYTLNASAFDSTDMYFSARANPAGPVGPPADLVVIDTATGIIASLGVIPDMDLMNAIEIYEDMLGPTVTITAPTKSSTTTITDTTVQAIDPGGILAANVTATGGTLNCTQTSGTQVDCTSSITASGTLTVTATDNWGNATVLAEAGYTVTTTATGGGGAAGGSSTPYVSPTTTTDEEGEESATEEGEEGATTEGEEGTTPEGEEWATTEEVTASEQAFGDVSGHWAVNYIARVFADGYIQGYEDNTFKPDQGITRAEVSKLIAMWLNSALTDEDCDATLFSDVSCDAWYGKFVTYLYIREIIMGYEDGTFGPDRPITRAEALKILIYAKGLQNTDISDITNPFSDVSAEDWYHDIVMIAYKLSIVKGYEDGTFGPGRDITRAEFTKIFVETLLNN